MGQHFLFSSFESKKMTIIASRWSVTWIELKSNFIIEKVFGEFNRIFIYYRFDLHFCQFLENWSLLLWWLTKFSRSLHHENQSYSWSPKYFITKNICLIKPETNDFSFFAKDYCQHEAQMRGLLSLLMENLSVRDDYCSNSVVKVAGGWWVVGGVPSDQSCPACTCYSHKNKL